MFEFSNFSCQDSGSLRNKKQGCERAVEDGHTRAESPDSLSLVARKMRAARLRRSGEDVSVVVGDLALGSPQPSHARDRVRIALALADMRAGVPNGMRAAELQELLNLVLPPRCLPSEADRRQGIETSQHTMLGGSVPATRAHLGVVINKVRADGLYTSSKWHVRRPAPDVPATDTPQQMTL